MATNEQRLAALFCGLDRAYGLVTKTGKKDGRGKVAASYITRREPLHPSVWTAHLRGEHTLVPIPIRDDATTGFGAIDIDTYPLDLPALVRRVEELKLPLVCCRSKSGGAHLFLFLTEPYDAEEVQSRLMDWAVALGYPGVEVFPKQVTLANENDVGNGIAAPYRDSDKTVEYAIGPDGEALSLAGFLDLAEARRVAGENLPVAEVTADPDLEGAPPCLCHWATIGVGEGQRNEVMFDFAVFAKKKWPDSWREKAEEMNRRYITPPLSSQEVVVILGSVAKSKSYTYKAKCEGPYCQPQLCRKRRHGRGGGYDDPGVVVDSMTIVTGDPPTYIVTVNGRRIELSGDEFRDQRRFRARVEDTLFIPTRPMKPDLWEDLRRKLMTEARHEEAPEDVSPRGQLVLHLHDFLDQYVDPDREKLRLNHAWFDEESGRTYFCSKDFLTYLRRNRVFGVTTRDIYNALREQGGAAGQLRVGKQVLRVWWLPRAPVPDEPLAIPDIPKDDDIPF